MIVPFFFDLYEYTNNSPKYLVWFYKFAEFVYKNNYKIIAQEKYIKDPNEYLKLGHWAPTNDAQKAHLYRVLNKEELDSITYVITEDEEAKIVKEYSKYGDPAYVNLKKTNKYLENKIENFIKENKNISAFVTWMWNPSLEKVATKYNIKIINMELSTIRYPAYNGRIGYFSFSDRYDNKNICDLYNQFLNSKDKIFLLSRKELLALFLMKKDLHLINELYKAPQYTIGFALGLDNDYYEKRYSDIKPKFVLEKLKKLCDKNEILIRPHPACKNEDLKEFNLDYSNSSKEWICKCKNIVYNISNVGYEAMLFQRGSIPISPALPTSFNSAYDLSYIPDDVSDILKLNFITFGVYAPLELMFTKEYINFRLEKTNIIDIYNKNLNYILKEKKLSLSELKSLSQEERFIKILKKVHNLNDNEIKKVVDYSYKTNYEEKQSLKEENKSLKNQLNSVLNSKSWKLTKPIRKFMNIFK